MGLPPDVPCCDCGSPSKLSSQKDQGNMMTEDGREVENPLTCAIYTCAQGHETQVLFLHELEEIRIQETPDAIIF